MKLSKGVSILAVVSAVLLSAAQAAAGPDEESMVMTGSDAKPPAILEEDFDLSGKLDDESRHVERMRQLGRLLELETRRAEIRAEMAKSRDDDSNQGMPKDSMMGIPGDGQIMPGGVIMPPPPIDFPAEEPVIVSQPPMLVGIANGWATIKVDGNDIRMKKGDTLPTGDKVVSIGLDQVVLAQKGKKSVLRLTW